MMQKARIIARTDLIRFRKVRMMRRGKIQVIISRVKLRLNLQLINPQL